MNDTEDQEAVDETKGKYRDPEARRRYRAEWMRKRRQDQRERDEGERLAAEIENF